MLSWRPSVPTAAMIAETASTDAVAVSPATLVPRVPKVSINYYDVNETSALLCPRPYRAETLSDDVRLTSDVCLSVAYIGPKSRTERPRNTKIGTEVAHVTRDSDTTFKVKRSKVNLQGLGHIVAASRTACYLRQGGYVYIGVG